MTLVHHDCWSMTQHFWWHISAPAPSRPCVSSAWRCLASAGRPDDWPARADMTTPDYPGVPASGRRTRRCRLLSGTSPRHQFFRHDPFDQYDGYNLKGMIHKYHKNDHKPNANNFIRIIYDSTLDHDKWSIVKTLIIYWKFTT